MLPVSEINFKNIFLVLLFCSVWKYEDFYYINSYYINN